MTAQTHEKLILNGRKTSMASCPPLPKNHPRVIELTEEEIIEEIKKNPRVGDVFNTACWRGYIGTWEIKNGQFYLVNIIGRYKMIGSEPIPADWVSGVIRIPKGEMLYYEHMGFASVYEEELYLKIEKGKVTKALLIDNRGKDISACMRRWRQPGFENFFEDGEEL